jgi:hypothetical protein
MFTKDITITSDVNGNLQIQPAVPAPITPPTPNPIPTLQYKADLGVQIASIQTQISDIMSAINTMNTASIDIADLVAMVNVLLTEVTNALPAQVATPPQQIKQ